MSVNNNLQTGQGRIRVAKFTASGSWTAPAGVYAVNVLAVGGGGGGGGVNTTTTNVATSGGGGGGGVFDGMLSVVPGTTYTVTIATGGNGATSGAAAGSNGGDTTFGSLMTAPGGQGGASTTNGSVTAPTTNPGGSSGGFGYGASAASYAANGGGHGAGAASPILPAFSTSFSATTHAQLTYTFFDGYSNRTHPYMFTMVPGAIGSSAIVAASNSAITQYPNIKRHTNPSKTMSSFSYIPGWAWKNLGAGGAGVMTGSTSGVEININHGMTFIHPTAGFVNVTTSISLDNPGGTGGTNSWANSGSGGGGARSYGATYSAAGGNGGSGYLEVSWFE